MRLGETLALNTSDVDIHSNTISVSKILTHDENHKPKDYHFNKFKLCKDKNIRLVSIYESDWFNKRDNIINLLKNIFIESKVIYARNCTIGKLDYKTKSAQVLIDDWMFYKSDKISGFAFG